MTTPNTKFRSLEDVKKKLIEMQDQLRLDDQLVDKTAKALAKLKVQAGDLKIKIMDISGDGKPKKRKTFNCDFPVVKVPNIKELTSSYALAERMSEQYKYVMNLENEVKMNFSGMKHSAIEATMGSIEKLKSSLQATLSKLFMSLHLVANGHAPKEYLHFVEALATEIQENRHIECDAGKTMTYAAVGKDENGKQAIVFAGYIMLTNAVSDEGKIAPTLYIIIKWTVGGNVEIFVEHEFIAPSLLQGGTTVENLKEATKSVTDQLSLEGFSSQVGNLPVSMQLKYPESGLSRDLFSAAEAIDTVEAKPDELIFSIKPKFMKDIEKIQHQLFLEVRAMLKRKKTTTVRMNPKGHQLIFTFTGLDAAGGIHPYDLSFLGERYRLNDGQLRKIANIVNGE